MLTKTVLGTWDNYVDVLIARFTLDDAGIVHAEYNPAFHTSMEKEGFYVGGGRSVYPRDGVEFMKALDAEYQQSSRISVVTEVTEAEMPVPDTDGPTSRRTGGRKEPG